MAQLVAAGYVRVSRMEGDKESPEDYKRAITAHCERKGYLLADVFEDTAGRGVSESTPQTLYTSSEQRNHNDQGSKDRPRSSWRNSCSIVYRVNLHGAYKSISGS